MTPDLRRRTPEESRRLLVVTYHFWNRTAQGLASGKLVDALAERGHEVTVLTAPGSSGAAPGREVDGKEHGGRSGRLSVVEVEPVEAPAWWRGLRERARRSWTWDKIYAAVSLAFGCDPDAWGWIAAASEEVVRRWRDTDGGDPGFDVLVTILNPALCHFVGLRAKRAESAVPWCAYFSDPWPHHLYPDPYDFTVGPVARWRLEQVLDRILRTADSLVFPSARLRDHLLAGPRKRFRDRTYVAPHLAALPSGELPAPSADGPLTLRHAGFLMKERKIEPLLEALRGLRHEDPEAFAEMRVEFVGRYEGSDRPEPPSDLANTVEFRDYMSPEETVAWMAGAHVQLLVEAKMEEGVFFPSKLADYMAVGRPVLALSPERGVVADHLRAGGGIRVEPDDAGAIRSALARLHAAWKAGRLSELEPGPDQVEALTADRVIPVWEDAFERAVVEVSGNDS